MTQHMSTDNLDMESLDNEREARNTVIFIYLETLRCSPPVTCRTYMSMMIDIILVSMCTMGQCNAVLFKAALAGDTYKEKMK